MNVRRKETLWSKASMLPTPELMEQAAGEPLNARHFDTHLKACDLGKGHAASHHGVYFGRVLANSTSVTCGDPGQIDMIWARSALVK